MSWALQSCFSGFLAVVEPARAGPARGRLQGLRPARSDPVVTFKGGEFSRVPGLTTIALE